VPFSFHGLEKVLSKDPQLAISKGLSWFAQDQKLFQFRGGRVLSNAFPQCTDEFASALVELVKTGGETAADFALDILANYHGATSTYIVLKHIVAQYSHDTQKMNEVRSNIDTTGVVSGPFGIAEAWRTKKLLLTEWLADERPAVKTFAERHIAELDVMIASEQRRAEADSEMRTMSYEMDDELENDEEKGA
jgi:hypothetical protein